MGFYRRNFPHLFIPGYPIFVTTRLTRSIPTQKLKVLHDDFNKKWYAISENENFETLEADLHREFFKKYDELLHANYLGPHWLINDDIAQIVSDSLHWGDGERYDLIAFTIMPNHIHLVLKPNIKMKGETNSNSKKKNVKYYLAGILESMKKYTSREANKVLKRKGRFWQHESYDHLLRDKKELHRSIKYTLMDPVRAGFVLHWQDYKWNYLSEKYQHVKKSRSTP